MVTIGRQTIARAGVGYALHKFAARYPRALAERMLRHAGIGAKQLADTENCLSHRALVETLEIGARETDDAAFGLTFAELTSWSDLGALSYVIFNSPTVGAALENACRYFALQQSSARPALEAGDSAARFVYAMNVPDVCSHAQHSESILAMVVRVCRDGSGNAEWLPREVHFKHSRPEDNTKAKQFFRCRIVYDQPVDAVVMSLDDLHLPVQAADRDVLPHALRDTDAVPANAPRAFDLVDHVARLVLSSLSTGDDSIEQVAAHLGASPRTVQRRLRDRGVVFNDMVASIRLELSHRYLSDPSLTLTDVAFLLGNSDLSAFSRAFRRWTGQTAIAYRRDQLRKNTRRP